MTEQTKYFLSQLDDLLVKGDQTAEEVSQVLTALRGPDNQQGTLKEETTNVIRTVALPKTSKAARLGQVTNIAMSFGVSQRARFGVPRTPTASSVQTFQDGHFYGHIQKAAEVLGVPYKKA